MRSHLKFLVVGLVAFIAILAYAQDAGRLGENVFYSYDRKDSTLTISGSGPMYDYSGMMDESRPLEFRSLNGWNISQCTKKIIVNEGVTSIGNFMFICFSNLEDVVLPGSLISIGHFAFNECNSLSSVFIPAQVSFLGESAFYDCPLEKIVVDEGNSVFDSRENCNAIIETSSNKLVVGGCNSYIPGSIKVIGEASFMESNIAAVKIPSSVTEIEKSAFRECANLREVGISPSVEVIGDYAFFGCNNLEVVEVGWTVPPLISQYVFFRASKKCLIVPEGYVEAYREASEWRDFEKIITMTGIKHNVITECDNNRIFDLYGRLFPGEAGNTNSGIYVTDRKKVILK